MRIGSATFITGAVAPAGYPKGHLPEVAFGGRSNVGKSTLINALLNRKHLVKTSSTPGKTREINFFLINECFHLVDLPGYGYAKVPRSEKARWSRNIETYLAERPQLRLVVVLVDIRHPPSEQDQQMVTWLTHLGRPFQVVATKCDKLSRSSLAKALSDIERVLAVRALPVSGQTRQGLAPLWKIIGEAFAIHGD